MTESKLFAPSIQRCAGCIFSAELKEYGVTACRRHPPHATSFLAPNREVEINTAWPQVIPNHDWCGDFEPREVERQAEAET